MIQEPEVNHLLIDFFKVPHRVGKIDGVMTGSSNGKGWISINKKLMLHCVGIVPWKRGTSSSDH